MGDNDLLVEQIHQVLGAHSEAVTNVWLVDYARKAICSGKGKYTRPEAKEGAWE